jgi:hypothetical protein
MITYVSIHSQYKKQHVMTEHKNAKDRFMTAIAWSSNTQRFAAAVKQN